MYFSLLSFTRFLLILYFYLCLQLVAQSISEFCNMPIGSMKRVTLEEICNMPSESVKGVTSEDIQQVIN